VIGGVGGSTFIGILFVPAFFVVILRLFRVRPTMAAADETAAR